ncbi:MAG: hypothetical protein BWY70_00806 [Bacteroidetes bacterium ADurb.Bin408]|nr:MAG: hypothetical protein BWY70_00806 [Bacteroidetes bacterium ADurb.Bin408]
MTNFETPGGECAGFIKNNFTYPSKLVHSDTSLNDDALVGQLAYPYNHSSGNSQPQCTGTGYYQNGNTSH